MQFRAVKGMNDILPDEARRWQRVEQAFKSTVELYGFSELRTPLLEYTELFQRSTGETSEIVEKQMFVLTRSGESLALRPEGTPGAARAYLSNNVNSAQPVTRWYYLGPMFRAEQPQRGRYRQFYQAGCEVYGDPSAACDAELIDMLHGFLSGLGVGDLTISVNSLGGSGTRARYREALLAHLRPRSAALSEHAQKRLEDNPLRILDSKDPRDRAAVADAPSILELLEPDDRAHWEELLRTLDALGTPYQVTPTLVRGLDYYTRTLFEFQSGMGELGAQNTVLGGGRYDGMLESLGGPKVPAVGFALGLDRLVLAMSTAEAAAPRLCFVAPLGERGRLHGLVLARDLRARGIQTEFDGRGNSMKSMLRRADALGARVCILVGDSEIERGVVQVKNLAAHTQEELPRAEAVARIAALFSDASPALGGTR